MAARARRSRPFAQLLERISPGKYSLTSSRSAPICQVDARAARSAALQAQGRRHHRSARRARSPRRARRAPGVHLGRGRRHVREPRRAWRRRASAPSSRAATRGPRWELVAALARALGYAMHWKKLKDVRKAMDARAAGARPRRKAAPADARRAMRRSIALLFSGPQDPGGHPVHHEHRGHPHLGRSPAERDDPGPHRPEPRRRSTCRASCGHRAAPARPRRAGAARGRALSCVRMPDALRQRRGSTRASVSPSSRCSGVAGIAVLLAGAPRAKRVDASASSVAAWASPTRASSSTAASSCTCWSSLRATAIRSRTPARSAAARFDVGAGRRGAAHLRDRVLAAFARTRRKVGRAPRRHCSTRRRRR